MHHLILMKKLTIALLLVFAPLMATKSFAQQPCDNLSVGSIQLVNHPSACGSTDGSIRVSVDGGSGSYQYALNGSSTYTNLPSNGIITGLAVDTYKIYVQDANNSSCGTAISKAITLRAFDSDLDMQIVSNNASICGNNNGSLSTITTGGVPPYSYTLNGSPITPIGGNILSLKPGVYVVNVKEVGGCVLSGEVVINATNGGLNATASNIMPATCGSANGGFTLNVNGTAPYTYQINGGLLTSSSSSTILINDLGAGSHTWWVADATGCYAEGRTNISNGNLAVTPTAVNNDVNAYISLSISGGTSPFNYSIDNGLTWAPLTVNSNKAVITNLSQGTYDVMVKDDANCIYSYSSVKLNESAKVNPSSQKIIYVKQGATGDGSSWNDATPELAYALKYAELNPDSVTEIWVAAGTYKPLYKIAEKDNSNNPTTDRDRAFMLSKNVAVYGGFSGTESSLAERNITANVTTLSGDLNDDDVEGDLTINRADNTYHVVIAIEDMSTNAHLDGFNIIGGMGDGTGYVEINYNIVRRTNGGGIYSVVTVGTLKLVNNIVHNNMADYGAGIYASTKATSYYLNASVEVTNNIVYSNQGNVGSGIYINTSSNFDVGATALVAYNSVYDNTAYFQGGGMCAVASDETTIMALNNNMYNNTVDSYGGGGIYIGTSSSSNSFVKFANNSVYGNRSKNAGGGVDVYAYTNGASETATVYLFNNIIWGNTTINGENNLSTRKSSGSGTKNIYLGNSLIGDASLSAGASDVGTLANLFDVDPKFVDAANGNLNLRNSSPAIDNGNNDLYTSAGGNIASDTDIAGNPRVLGTIDMGAYEQIAFSPNSSRLYVKQNAKGNGNGSSWTNAIPEIADALIYAADNPNTVEEIWVAAGIYRPLYITDENASPSTDPRDRSFILVKDVAVYGGFPTNANDTDNNTLNSRDWRANKTTLSGDLNANDVEGDLTSNRTDNVYHVVIATGDMGTTTRLDGFNITGGTADGGSVIIVNSQPVVSYEGGGTTIRTNTGSLTLSNNSIYGNTCNNGGGGIYANIENSNVSLANNSVYNNKSGTYGGGLYIMANATTSSESAAITVINNSIYNNSTDGYGGGVYAFANSLGTSVINLINSSVYGNISSNSGNNIGGIYASVTAFDPGNIGTANIYNSIIWGNSGKNLETNLGLLGGSEAINLANTLIGDAGLPDNTVDGGNNIYDTNPLFTDAANADFSLQPTSPAINAGNNSYYTAAGGNITTDTDIAGSSRLRGSAIDMGAYEAKEVPVITWPTSATITYGQSLSEAVFTGGSGNGTFAFHNGILKPTIADSNITDYVLVFTPTDSDNYSSLTKADMKVTVNKATLAIAARALSIAYGTSPDSFLAGDAYDIVGFVNNENEAVLADRPKVQLASSITTTSPAGSYPNAVEVYGASAISYNITYIFNTLTITQAPNGHITFDAIPNKTYGDAPFNLSGRHALNKPLTYSSDNNIVTVNSTGQGWEVTINGAGTVTLTASFNGDDDVEAESVSQTITIAKTQLTVTARDQERLYGELNPDVSSAYDYSNFINAVDESLFIVVPKAEIDPQYDINTAEGTYPGGVLVSDGDHPYYDLIHVAGTLIIHPLSGDIFFNTIGNKVYGDAVFNLTATHTGGNSVIFESLNPDIIEVFVEGGVNKARILKVGTAQLRAHTNAANGYPSAQIIQTVVVEKATLTIRPYDIERPYGEQNPDFTLEFSGLKYNDAENDFGTIIISCDATTTSPAGTYNITASGAANNNYNILYNNGILTVTQPELAITVTVDNSQQDEKTGRYVLSCGINQAEVTVTVSDPTAKVYYNNVEENPFTVGLEKDGIHTITFTVVRDQNSSSYTIEVVKPFAFSSIIHKRWGNTLTVINNPANNGGYTFTSYKWYFNGNLISTSQSYSAGNDGRTLPAGDYHVELTANEFSGSISTCVETMSQSAVRNNMVVYPNPARRGSTVTVKSDLARKPGAIVEFISLNGIKVSGVLVSDENITLAVPTIAGTYIVRISNNGQTETFKLIVE